MEQLEAAILGGRLSPGEPLASERELMAQFQVGRTAVREALFALQRRGLVALQNGERANVTLPTSRAVVGEMGTLVRFHLADPVGAGEFQTARMLFETGLARLAAETATAADLAVLGERLAANGAALADPARFIETDVAFHLAIAEVSGNSIFTALYGALAEWLREQRSSSIRVNGSAKAAFAAHRRIHQAIAARDPDAAAAAMRGHLEEVAGYLRRAERAA